MMNDFYTSNGISTLQFGTQTNGLEQGASGTASGARVLSRSSSTACLQTLIYNSATDATTSDSATYPDDCYFDPRYAPWYEYARQYTVPGGASDPATLLLTLYEIGSTGHLGSGAAEAVYADGAWSTASSLTGEAQSLCHWSQPLCDSARCHSTVQPSSFAFSHCALFLILACSRPQLP